MVFLKRMAPIAPIFGCLDTRACNYLKRLEELGDVALLRKVRYWWLGFEVSQIYQSQPMRQDVALNYCSSICLHTTMLLPAIMIMD